MYVARKVIQTCVVMSIWLGSVACATADPPVGKSMDSLYARLGEKPAIVKVIDEFVSNVAKDDRVNGRFATTNIPRFKGHMVDQVCAATGGPCAYTGRDMVTTHKGMGISNAEFSAIVEDLVSALNTLKVPKAEQKELLGLLGPMKTDIVEVP